MISFELNGLQPALRCHGNDDENENNVPYFFQLSIRRMIMRLAVLLVMMLKLYA